MAGQAPALQQVGVIELVPSRRRRPLRIPHRRPAMAGQASASSAS